jgi:hypothetical protein
VKNIRWGRSRAGHPEGTVEAHIKELEDNLEKMGDKVSDSDYWKLKVLIHVHDTFKADATAKVPIEDPNSHASLAAKFLKDYCPDPALLEIVQNHDVPYALWRKYWAVGSYDAGRMNMLLAMREWDLFLTFYIIDSCTEGKSREPLRWFLEEVAKKKESKIGLDDIM